MRDDLVRGDGTSEDGRWQMADGRRQVIPCERLPSVARSLPSGMPGLLNDNAPAKRWLGRCTGCRRRPTLPRSLNRSTIGAVGLNDRVRNGNECGPYALVASVFVEIIRQWEWVVFGGANPD